MSADNFTEYYLYVIASSEDGPVKLGISTDPNRRCRELQTGHADELHVWHREPVGGDLERAKAFETLLHRGLHHCRRGGEWFNLNTKSAAAQVTYVVMRYMLIEDLAEKVRRRLV